MSMRTATMPASREVCSATPGVVPNTTFWMTFDNRLLSPSIAWEANSTLVVPPTVVSVTPGMVSEPPASVGSVTLWLTRTSFGVFPTGS